MNNKGQALVEYILIIGVVSALVIGTLLFFKGYLDDAAVKASCSMSGEIYIKGHSSGEGKCVDPTTLEESEEKEESELLYGE